MAQYVLAAVSTGMQYAGAIREGAAAEAASNYNAAIGHQQANMAISQAQELERRTRINSKKQIGSMKANYAASGVELEGSPLDIIQESASNAELDALNARHQGQLQAWALRAGAGADLLKGRAAREAGQFKASAALMDLGTKYASQGGSGGGGGGKS